ncbi:hypothetical protein M758_4G119800 [Ceratodon purpureus]|nr:hypothetical protein M758_4G119800 [Ceratodon purpureus]
MYTSSAAQHLLSPSFVHHSSLKVFASKSSASIPAALKRLACDTVPASVSHFVSPCSLREGNHSWVLGVRGKGGLLALRALGYNDGDDDDDVYVKSFRPSRGSPQDRNERGMGERRSYNDGGDSYSRFSSDAREGQGGRGSTSERSGFKAGFRGGRGGGRGGSSSDRVAPRDTFSRGERVEGEDVASSRGEGRGEWGNRGGRSAAGGRGSSAAGGRGSSAAGGRGSSAGRGRGSNAGRGRGSSARGRGAGGRANASNGNRPNNGLVLDEATGEMVEYRHPDWKEDPKAARKAKREPAVAPQVHFENPMSKQPHVAILGGGMSGLVCALTLEELGIRSTVFDTGKHGLGGRMATRNIHIRDGLNLAFDHAAQYFTVSDPKFRKLVDRWLNEGAVKEWKGVVGTLQAGGKYSGLADDVPRYVGTHGMRPLADHMVSQGRLIEVKRPVWISNMDAKGPLWHLNENGKPHGEYDAVVIAHNGKCANRLLAPSGAPEVFRQMKRLELSSIWALMAAFEEPLPIPEGLGSSRLDGAFVEGVNAVTWMANNSSKIEGEDSPQCWTFFSSAAYGKKNKVPQESVPAVKAERVRREMLEGVGTALGLPEGSMPTPFFTKVQLW